MRVYDAQLAQKVTMGLPTKVLLNPAPAILQVGQTLSLTPTLFDIEGNEQTATQPFTWTLGNSYPAVATVDSNGLITAIGPGTCEIICNYPWASSPASGATISAVATITVQAPQVQTAQLFLTTDKPVGTPYAGALNRGRQKVVPA